MSTQFAQRIELVRPSAIRELLRLGADPSITSFGGGYPDPALFPMDGLRAVYSDLLEESGRGNLQYTESMGTGALREIIASLARNDGMDVTAADIVVLHGAQQGLDLVAKLLVDRGQTIVTENPTFLGALIAFNPYEPGYLAIDSDEEGMRTDLLAEALERDPGIRFVYLIPDHQNPTGSSMSLARRREIVALAQKHDVFILEDSPYRELRYEGENLPTLYSLDDSGHVIHLGSFSKTLAPGMRIGWAIAPAAVLDKLILLKMAADTQSSTLNMAAASAFLERFDLDAHIVRAREAYRRKRDVMLAAMDEHFPDTVAYTRPKGGLFIWATFPDGFDTAEFMGRRSLPEAHVAYVPGESFFPGGGRPNHARFSYSGVPDQEMVDGLTRLGALLSDEFSRGTR
jgi:2-aminoadipate transaminase